MNPLITIHKITKYQKKNKFLLLSHFNKKAILKKFNLHIYKGDFIGLVGESGSGKSTLGKILVGLEDIDSGQLFYEGKNFKAYKAKELKKKLQIVYQNPKLILDLKKTVYNIISEPIISYNICNKMDLDDRVMKQMKEVSLKESDAHTLAEDLSLVDLKKLMFARALAVEPEFIVIDELLSQQDSIDMHAMIRLIEQIKRHRDISILLISSNLKLIAKLVDKLAILYQGRLLEIIPKSNFYRMGAHPYTELLFDKEKFEDIDLKEYLSIIKVKRKRVDGRCVFLDRCNFVTEQCYKKKPRLLEIDQNHFVSCLLYEDKYNQ